MKVGEAGVTIVVGLTYDVSSKTSLTVTLIAPDDTEQTVADGDITVGSGTYNSEFGDFSANEYITFETTASMFDEDQIAAGADYGTWQGYVTYVDSGKTLISNTFSIQVEAVP